MTQPAYKNVCAMCVRKLFYLFKYLPYFVSCSPQSKTLTYEHFSVDLSSEKVLNEKNKLNKLEKYCILCFAHDLKRANNDDISII